MAGPLGGGTDGQNPSDETFRPATISSFEAAATR
jgi:hypothetical protein